MRNREKAVKSCGEDLEKEWEDFARATIPDEPAPGQVDQLRRAFMSGAFFLSSRLNRLARPSQLLDAAEWYFDAAEKACQVEVAKSFERHRQAEQVVQGDVPTADVAAVKSRMSRGELKRLLMDRLNELPDVRHLDGGRRETVEAVIETFRDALHHGEIETATMLYAVLHADVLGRKFQTLVAEHMWDLVGSAQRLVDSRRRAEGGGS